MDPGPQCSGSDPIGFGNIKSSQIGIQLFDVEICSVHAIFTLKVVKLVLVPVHKVLLKVFYVPYKFTLLTWPCFGGLDPESDPDSGACEVRIRINLFAFHSTECPLNQCCGSGFNRIRRAKTIHKNRKR